MTMSPDMPTAYAIVIRERTRDTELLQEYWTAVPATFAGRIATFLARHGRCEVLEGSACEGITIVEFPSYEDAQAWYHSAEYQRAADARHRGADYRVIIAEGVT